jgi:hypothetical protein
LRRAFRIARANAFDWGLQGIGAWNEARLFVYIPDDSACIVTKAKILRALQDFDDFQRSDVSVWLSANLSHIILLTEGSLP